MVEVLQLEEEGGVASREQSQQLCVGREGPLDEESELLEAAKNGDLEAVKVGGERDGGNRYLVLFCF